MREFDTVPRHRQRHRRWRWVVLGSFAMQGALQLTESALLTSAARAVEMPARAYRSGDLPREPSSLSEVQVLRAIPERLQRMQQRHESRRAARQASVPRQGRGREATSVASVESEVRREPAELSVQPLPPTNE